MKFSTHLTYGLRALIYLAAEKRESVSLKEISERGSMPAGYLEKIFARLKKAGLVKASKGSAGGYYLARKPRAISVLDIVSALKDGREDSFHCVYGQKKVFCGSACSCGQTDSLKLIDKAVKNAFAKIKLSQLI